MVGIVGGHGGGHGGDYHEQPDPFKFEYGVHDDKYYTDFSEHRAGDEYGNIVGEYQVALPDGRIQYVKLLLMVTMVVLSWRFHTREKQGIQILLLMEDMVDMWRSRGTWDCWLIKMCAEN